MRGLARAACAMPKSAILNQKGGVGKTTTAVNLSAALAALGRRVTLMDLDPQAHATLHLGIEPIDDHPSTYEVLTGERPYRITSSNLRDLERLICKTEPRKPSMIETLPSRMRRTA